jgi:hypothetical protein
MVSSRRFKQWPIGQMIPGYALRFGAGFMVNISTRLDDVYHRMRDILFVQPSAGVKASFSRLLARARTLEDDLRDWCLAECSKEQNVLVAEIGMDLIAGQQRLVSQSLFDLLSGRDV